MKCYLKVFLKASLLFCLALLLHCGEARVHTEVQAGPLYRVVGSPLYISCNVSGFVDEASQKEFEIRARKPVRPTHDLNVISSDDPGFAFFKYSQRASHGEITVRRVSPNSIIFEIQSLKKDDEGDYECTVINSEGRYDGTYSAITTVKVIDDSLSVSSSSLSSLSYDEGSALIVTCQASSNTIQHTHVSVAWYLHKGSEGDAQPIISLDRDLTLSPGDAFEERYQAGHIKLDKMGEANYRLTMDQLEVSDQGRIYCQAQEWIQDPDRSWYSIKQKNAEEIMLNVKAREVMPDMASLVVKILTPQTTLHEGSELSLTCSVETQNLEKSFFSVAWLRGSTELVRIGPTGILSVGSDYSGRETEGELRAIRITDSDYHLKLKPVRTEDQGEYSCKAWPEDRNQDGVFTKGTVQTSGSRLVRILATESGLSVKMQNVTRVNEGDGLKLTCKVDGIKDQLSITWQFKPTAKPSAPFTNVVSLGQEGVMEIDEKYMSRKVRASRPTISNFTLELDEVTAYDAGLYQCAVSEWKDNSKSNSQSQTASVEVVPTESFVKLDLKSRNNAVKIGESTELICRVKGPRVPLTLTWSLQRSGATDVETIVILSSNGNISWSTGKYVYQFERKEKEDAVFHILIIRSASQREAGNYQCSASVFQDNKYKKLKPSNQLAVVVDIPESKLTLISISNVTRNINTDVEINCLVTSATFSSSRYTVTWLQQTENKTIVNSDRDALVTFGPEVEPSDRQRINIRRTQGPNFSLIIQQAQVSDSDLYKCEVEEWQQDPRGDWYLLSQWSVVTQLTVVEPEKKLSIEIGKGEKNVSSNEDFTIPCHITTQSSNESEFQVTWFWQQMKTETHPIFTVHRNGTLQVRFGKDDHLRFSHPLPNKFSLTIMRPGSENSGKYFCEVEEWLPSLPHGWKRFAVEKSEPTTINVDGQANAEKQCTPDTWIGIFVAFAIASLVVIALLVMKICKGSAEKKPKESLWAEEHSLNTKLSGMD